MKRILITLLFCLLVNSAWAATRTWEGDDLTNPTYWNDADNWGGTVPVTGDDVVINNNKDCFVNAATAALKSLDMTDYTGTLSGTFNITVRGLTASTNVCKIAGTITWTGTLIFSPVSTTAIINLTTNSKLLTKMTVTSGAAVSLVVLQDNLSFTAATTDSITLTTQGLNLNGFTISGNSAINRLLITSVTLGTAVSLTVAGGDFAYCDFRDITFAGDHAVISVADNGGTARFATTAAHGYIAGDLIVSAVVGYTGNKTITNVSDTTHFDTADAYVATGAGATTYNLTAITGLSGDCGGNTGATFTTADDWYFYDDGAGTFNFSDYTQWYEVSGGTTQMAATRCVLPQDNAYFDASSINGVVTVDQDMLRLPNIDFTGVDAIGFHIDNIAQQFYGSLIFVSNVTVTVGTTYSVNYFGRRGSYILDTLGKTMRVSYFTNYGATYTLASNYQSGNSAITFNYGTFDADIYNVSARACATLNTTIARQINMGSGTWTITPGSSETCWDFDNVTSLTLEEEDSTIVIVNTTYAVTFKGGNQTYNHLTINTSTGIPTFTGSNTFSTFTIFAPKTVKFAAETITTVNSFVATGTAVDRITITSATSATHTLTDTSGINAVEYCTISYSQAGGGATWNALVGCTDGGNNTGWIFGGDDSQVMMIM